VEPTPELTMQMVAGSYKAADTYGAFSFTTTEGGQTTDWLEKGAFVLLELNADGTTAGRLFVPEADEDGSDLDEDLAGTWTISAGRVLLSHSADTFLRDMSFAFRAGTMEGDESFGGVRVRLTLARTNSDPA
jgi:hypothetical protein